ncbi:MAG TPA: glycosyltransferase [Myxococcaceae bacterium]
MLCAFDVVPAPTGTSRRVTDYLKALNGRFSVVAMTAKTPDVSHIERYQGARLLRVPVGAGDLVSKVQTFERAVRRQLESEEFALAHYFDPFAGYTLAELRGDYGYRLLYEAHAFPSLDLRFTQPQLEGDRRFLAKVRRQELFCLLNADAVVTSSELASSYIQSLGVPPDRIRLIRAPVEVAAYAARATEPDATPMRIIYAGSQVSYQGLPTLLRAARPLLAKDEARLTLLGPRHPDWHGRLEDLVDDLALHGRVDLHPPVTHDDLPKMLAASDVAVLPLEDEERTRATGGALAKVSEYLAAGRPVIASDLPVTRELLPPSCTTFVPPGDPAALGAALQRLAENPRLRVEMGRAARAEALRLVDSAVIRPRILSLYSELLGRERGAAASVEPSGVEESADLTATPTSKVYASGRASSSSSDSGSGRTPVSRVAGSDSSDSGRTPISYLPRAAANAKSYTDPPVPGARTDPEGLASAAQQAPTARLEAIGSLLGSREGTDPAARVPSDYTPRPTPAPDEDTAIIPEPIDPNESSDSNITSPGAPIPGLESLERAAEAALEQAPSVVVSPSVLAEASWLGERPPAPTTPALGLPAATSNQMRAYDPPPAPSGPPDNVFLSDDVDVPQEPTGELEPPATPPPEPEAPAGPVLPPNPFDPGTPEVTPAALTPPEDLRSAIAAAIQNNPTQPRSAMNEPDSSSALEEPEEIDPEDVVDAEGTSRTGLPISILDSWLSQVVHGYCPPEGIEFSRPLPPTTMPGRDPHPATPFPSSPTIPGTKRK